LGTSIVIRIIFPLNYFAKRSFATKGVPKQELGNQRNPSITGEHRDGKPVPPRVN
jgi:hypothetical protein